MSIVTLKDYNKRSPNYSKDRSIIAGPVSVKALRMLLFGILRMNGEISVLVSDFLPFSHLNVNFTPHFSI